MNWNELSIQEKADLMKLYVANGITSLDTMKEHYNNFQEGGYIKTNNTEEPNFITRLKQGYSRKGIIDNQGNPASHKLSVVDGRVYPEVQEDEKGNLRDYGTIPYRKFYAYDRALKNNDYIEFPNDESAVNFTEHYKDAAIYPWYGTFDNYFPWRYQDGGDTKKPRGYRVSSAIMNLAHRAVDKNAAGTIDTPDNGAPQSTFLMNRKNQQKVFEDEGYTKVDNNDYGPVTNAVNTSRHKDVPVYQKYPNANVVRNNLQKIGTFMDYAINNANTETSVYNGPVESYLTDPANFPVDVYIDRKTGKVYNQGWDFNDYHNIRSTTGISKLKNVAGNILDRIGNPTVVTTGLQENTIKSTEADRYLQSKNPMLSYQKNEDTGEYEIMMKPVTVTAKKTNPVKPKVKLRPASELNEEEFWDMMEANSKQNGGRLYQEGGPVYTPPSIFATPMISTGDNVQPIQQRIVENNQAAKEAKKQAAIQAYLDRRGYISEDKDKRSYKQRDFDNKVQDIVNTTISQASSPGNIDFNTLETGISKGMQMAMLPEIAHQALVRPIATNLGLLGTIGSNKIIKAATPYSSWGNMISEGIFNNNDIRLEALGEFTNPFGWLGGVYGNGVENRLGELMIRRGDALKNGANTAKNILKHVFPDVSDYVKETTKLKHPVLRYALDPRQKDLIYKFSSLPKEFGELSPSAFPYGYSGNNSNVPFKGDIVDIFFNKKLNNTGFSYTRETPTFFETYMQQNYPYKKPYWFRIGEASANTPSTRLPNKGWRNDNTEAVALFPEGSEKSFIDPGGFNLLEETPQISHYADIWKYNGKDALNRYYKHDLSYTPEGQRQSLQSKYYKPIIKYFGDFIDAHSTPIITQWYDTRLMFQKGGSLGHITPYGQWQYPHQITTIPSNNITMKGVNYPVIGISDTGDTKYMLPNMDYLFDGQYVTEYPINK